MKNEQAVMTVTYSASGPVRRRGMGRLEYPNFRSRQPPEEFLAS